MMRGQRLLLVEDDAATREVLTLLLEGEGWAVDAAESGEAALDLLTRGGAAPVTVLCDLHLPGLCGEALARTLRGALGSEVVVVAMTASVRPGAGAGYDAVLGKPFAVEAVEEAWRRGGASDEVGCVDVLPGGAEDRFVLDEAVVATLRRQMGDAGARGFYAFALEDAGDRVRRMEAAIARREREAFVREAHAVKGSCAMMGARGLWRLASDAEVDGLCAGSGEVVSRMGREIDAVFRMLETTFEI